MVYTQGGYQKFEYYNSNGIVLFNDLNFDISLGSGNSGPAYINSTFDLADMFLTGNFAVYSSGNQYDFITGFYSANQSK
jgi:PPE-repeat protein